jgi:predicted GNAT family N-acyltransferase
VLSKTFAAEFRIEPLDSRHDRIAFHCGVLELDDWLHHRAGQDQKRKLAAVFVLTRDGISVSGFYSLSAHSILASDLPPEESRRLPRFPLPVTLLGRMAVEQSLHGRKLGEHLLLHAFERALAGSRQIASWAVIVDAKADAREFYLRHGFIPCHGRPERLFLPMKTIERLFQQ